MDVNLLKAAIVRRLGQGTRLKLMSDEADRILARYDSSTNERSVVYEFYLDSLVMRANEVVRIAYSDIAGFDWEEPTMGTEREFDVILKSGDRVRVYVAGEYSARGTDGWAEVYDMHRLLKEVQFLARV